MSKVLVYENYELTIAGGTKNFDIDTTVDIYRIYTTPGGGGQLGANMFFGCNGTPYAGLEYTFIYDPTYLSGSGIYGVYFMGTRVLVADQNISALYVVCYYDGSQWLVRVLGDICGGEAWLGGSSIMNGTLYGNKLIQYSTPLDRISVSPARGYAFRAGIGGVLETFSAATSGQILIGNGTDLISSPVTGDVTISGSGVTAIGSNKVITSTINTGAVTLGKLETILKTEVEFLNISFESGETGDFKIEMPYAGSLVGIYAYVYKAIASTDNGTITPKNNAGTTMGSGTITFTASDPRGTAYTSVPSTNNTFVIGDILTFTSAKTTAGGKVTLSLSIIRS